MTDVLEIARGVVATNEPEALFKELHGINTLVLEDWCNVTETSIKDIDTCLC